MNPDLQLGIYLPATFYFFSFLAIFGHFKHHCSHPAETNADDMQPVILLKTHTLEVAPLQCPCRFAVS